MKRATRDIFLATVFLYIVLGLVPSKALAIIAILFYVGGLAFWLKSVPEALCTAYVALLPISRGKHIFIPLISTSGLHILGRLWGIDADIIFTARELMVSAMAALLLWRTLQHKHVRWFPDRFSRLLFLLPLVFIFITFVGSLLPWVSLFHALFFIEPFLLYVYARTYNVTNYTAFFAAIAASMSFEAILALMQNLKAQTLGLVIEDYPGYIPLDMSRDTLGVVFRFGGTFFDANTLAHYLIFALLVLLPTVFDAASGLRLVSGLAITLGAVALIVTRSRSAWLAASAGLLLFFYLVEKIWRIRLRLRKAVRWGMLVSAPILLTLGAMVVIPRIAGTAYTFERFGSSETRKLLIEQAFSVIIAHPFFGVGMAMDVYYMFLNMAGPKWGSVLSYFPEPVHNGFMRIFVQTGIVGFMPYVASWVALLFALWRLMKKANGRARLYMSGFFAALVASIVNAQLQPLTPDLALAVLFLMTWRRSEASERLES